MSALATTAAAPPRTWQRPPFIASPFTRWALYAGAALYLVLATASLDVNWVRVLQGLERGWAFVQGFLNPDFTSRWDDIVIGFQESLTMTVTSTALGVLLSIPVAVGAARNLAPTWIYLICRSFVALSRTLNEIIVAIFLVAMFGFGPFAGFLTLTFATIGFMAKLMAEDIEEIEASQLEALRATGAGYLQVLDFAVLSQVMPRLVGLSLYRLDINFRESAVIGIVGAGGIGATLNTAMDRYEFDSAAAIILVIIAIVMVAEYSSGWLRKRIQ
ncbi:MAG: phosphonate ABC transporter, permease protein PhnE [Hydrogenophaga sp.]|uniref:phosphonate ABC transporter, permease protein PhnE n=1 Tax=Hydrogenophaga sp. TaxID=1904254 RepID=UPI00271F7C6E|nr:phosphonate ABC transporter, permease protein PhnE [Hydrogenophaga sp.]MDO9481538.1 phosphonate ABC transporter, permease protein PhnE [Hydrogenophaga sp.]MDP2220485.1 phosphonate ABC transporter, permease protein PhnE [Hydrogenophaga sp.]MDP3344748.1 phosphonate ABC transporter, permease protein PhnE [Hydrogenophaga sp.]MDP3809148.1 phosphonate ABC transporter, permease protein PhnE [Hydrogenophaga sp.]MDZ4238828.1 phosphonate ABC transporter, permease protein PhnE [Hydrogenophaga sp.]